MNDLLLFLTQDLFTSVIGSVGILAAVTSLLSTTFGFLLHYWRTRSKLLAAEKATFSEVLESDDLLKLGNYLSSTLGRFTIQECTSRRQVADRVNQILARLASFIGDTHDEPASEPQVPLPEAHNQFQVPEEFAEVAREFEAGEVWNGLARLRRIIEVHLREYAISLGFKSRHLKSAGQILRLLRDREHVPATAANLLNFAIRICNEGVHGYFVSPTQAEEALSSAIDGLREIRFGSHTPDGANNRSH